MTKKLEINGVTKEYILYDDGRLYDVQLGRFKNPVENRKGYLRYSIYVFGRRKFFFVHRLVLKTFNPVDGMDNLQVNHIDGNKKNNHLENLEWCTPAENIRHAYKVGLKSVKGIKNPACRLTEENVREIVEMLLAKRPYKEISQKFNISKNTVAAIRSKRLWKDITKNVEF